MEYFEYRHDWAAPRVYFYDKRGCLTSIPAEWTSVVPADVWELMAAGRARFRLDDLLRLVDLIERVKAATGAPDDGGAVKGIVP